MVFRRPEPEEAATGTAQDAYKTMLRDHLSPRLRALGFKGSAGAYDWSSQSHWIILGVQASQFSDRDEMRFTLNCQVVRRDVWEEARLENSYVGPKPKPNTMAGNFVWWTRIGRLLPGGEDKWWSLGPSDDAEALATEVACAVQTFALPAMQREVEATSGKR
jgi:hypothetical protein